MVFDPERGHPGLADRLKAVISTYNIAKKNHYRFKLYFETPFRQSDYLAPQFNWEAHPADLEFSLLDTYETFQRMQLARSEPTSFPQAIPLLPILWKRDAPGVCGYRLQVGRPVPRIV